MVRVIILLDESGSMYNIRDDILSSVNSFIDKQKNVVEGQAEDVLTLIKFSDIVIQPFAIQDQCMNQLTPFNDYTPSGGTALFDAIGTAITTYQHEDKVVMVIVTDGQENASRKYTTKNSIQELISTQKEKGWNFVYLSTDIDTFTQGSSIGVNAAESTQQKSQSHNITKDYKSMGNYFSKQINDGVTNYRVERGKEGCAFSN